MAPIEHISVTLRKTQRPAEDQAGAAARRGATRRKPLATSKNGGGWNAGSVASSAEKKRQGAGAAGARVHAVSARMPSMARVTSSIGCMPSICFSCPRAL